MPEEYIETINGIPLKASLDIDALRNEVQITAGHCLETVTSSASLQLGTIIIKNTGWSYGNSQTRLRMPQNVTVHMRPGDSFGVTDNTHEPMINYGYRVGETYYAPLSERIPLEDPVAVDAEGDYVFVLSAGIDTPLEGDDLLAAFETFYISRYTNVAGDVKAALSGLTETLDIDPTIEIGNINISTNGWSYTEVNNRARTPKGVMYHLLPGDEVGFADLTERPAFAYGYRTDEGYYYPEAYWIYRGRLNVEAEGDYVFCFRTYGSATGQDLLDAIGTFYIKHRCNIVGDAGNAINALSDDVSKLKVNGQVECFRFLPRV